MDIMSNQKLEWHTEQRKVNELIPWEKNPRRMTPKQKEDLQASLERLNLISIPAIDINNKIISGHQRIRILQVLGRGDEIIDVRVPNRKLTEEEFREANLRENKNIGEWDEDLLKEFDPQELLDVGWTDEELTELFDDEMFGGKSNEGNTDPDAMPDPPAEPRAKYGDIYQLGRHRLMCGDSIKREDVERLMAGEKANMVFTDPPYGVSYADKNFFLNAIDKGNHNQKKIINDHQSEKDIQVLWKSVFEIIRDNLAEVNSYYIIGPQIQGMMMMMQEAGLPYRHVIIWVKNNHVLGRCDYHYKHEPIFFGWTTKHIFYGKGEFHTSVWEVDKPLKNDLHPTMKPIALIENALLNSSETWQICLDPFGGSGSTLIACEKTNRRCFMMELDAIYVDIILQRWEEYTGQKAVKL